MTNPWRTKTLTQESSSTQPPPWASSSLNWSSMTSPPWKFEWQDDDEYSSYQKVLLNVGAAADVGPPREEGVGSDSLHLMIVLGPHHPIIDDDVDQAVDYLHSLIGSRYPTLRILDVSLRDSQGGSRPDRATRIAHACLVAAARHESLAHVRLKSVRRNSIVSLETLIALLQTTRSIQTLNLMGISIRPDEWETTTTLSAPLPALLQDNLQLAFLHNTSLRTFRMEAYEKSSVMESIAAALGHHRFLTDVTLQPTGIDCVEALLHATNTVKALTLTFCFRTEATMRSLVEALQANRNTVEILSLEGAMMPAAERVWVEYLRSSTNDEQQCTLRQLSVSGSGYIWRQQECVDALFPPTDASCSDPATDRAGSAPTVASGPTTDRTSPPTVSSALQALHLRYGRDPTPIFHGLSRHAATSNLHHLRLPACDEHWPCVEPLRLCLPRLVHLRTLVIECRVAPPRPAQLVRAMKANGCLVQFSIVEHKEGLFCDTKSMLNEEHKRLIDAYCQRNANVRQMLSRPRPAVDPCKSAQYTDDSSVDSDDRHHAATSTAATAATFEDIGASADPNGDGTGTTGTEEETVAPLESETATTAAPLVPALMVVAHPSPVLAYRSVLAGLLNLSEDANQGWDAAVPFET